MKNLLCPGLVLVCLLWSTAFSTQNSIYQFPGEHNFAKAKIYFSNNTRIEVSKLKILDDQLSYMNDKSAQQGQTRLNEIFLLKVSEGNKILEYAFIGGGVMAVSALLAVVQTNANPMYKKADGGPIVLGFTAAGFLIGAIIGSNNYKWKTLYFKKDVTDRGFINYQTVYKPNNNSFGIQLSYNF